MERRFSEISKSQSITERFNGAAQKRDKKVNVTRGELDREFSKLAERGDEQAMRELREIFNAYFNFELQTASKDKSSEEIRLMALGNFDVVARVADARAKTGGDTTLALFRAVDKDYDNQIGKVRRFYREAVSYGLLSQRPT